MTVGRNFGLRATLFLGLLLLCAGATLLYWLAPSPSGFKTERLSQADDLVAACQATSGWLGRRLGAPCAVLVRPPFVLGGTQTPERIDAWQQRALQPVVAALTHDFFRQSPTEPVCVVLATDQAAYRRYARQLNVSGGAAVSPRAFYQSHLRLILVVADDQPAFRHELTHALMDFDFPAAPAWLREGLAALFEEVAWEGAPPQMLGQPGPRLETLVSALHDGRAETLEALWQRASLHDGDEALNYATARYFCLYLQRRGVLRQVYCEARDKHSADPQGSQAVRAALGNSSAAELNADFQAFVRQLGKPAEQTPR